MNILASMANDQRAEQNADEAPVEEGHVLRPNQVMFSAR